MLGSCAKSLSINYTIQCRKAHTRNPIHRALATTLVMSFLALSISGFRTVSYLLSSTIESRHFPNIKSHQQTAKSASINQNSKRSGILKDPLRFIGWPRSFLHVTNIVLTPSTYLRALKANEDSRASEIAFRHVAVSISVTLYSMSGPITQGTPQSSNLMTLGKSPPMESVPSFKSFKVMPLTRISVLKDVLSA